MLITHITGYHDNYFCEQECGKLPGGRLAVPHNREQYDCMTSAVGGKPRHGTSIWTGIRVRPEGGMFDPWTNQTVTVFDKEKTFGYRSISPYYSFLTAHSSNKTENCIYFFAGFFVETRCTFLYYYVGPPRQCACVQGNHFPDSAFGSAKKLSNLGYIKDTTAIKQEKSVRTVLRSSCKNRLTQKVCFLLDCWPVLNNGENLLVGKLHKRKWRLSVTYLCSLWLWLLISVDASSH